MTLAQGNGQGTGVWEQRGDGDGLPLPGRERWQPLRAGLVDLFLYDDEEFRFRDGHLLLRGNNGTGKSKVLALTLPFLLDGELAPHRVEPDADPAKRMEWNLLLGGRYQERLGYAWLELGRLTDHGTASYLTLGCGLKAVAGRGVPTRWLFITSQRVGRDIRFVSPARTALARERLIEALGEHGRVYDSAKAYRRAVDEHLFHLGATRYEAMVNLLVQLRQPQLSKRPDAGRLSRALSSALASLDQAVLADVAESFHDLERQRDELRDLRDMQEHVSRFLLRYRHYARVASRRHAGELRSAQAAYEAVNREIAAVREGLTRAREEQAATTVARDQAEREHSAALAEAQELAGRPELKDLDRAEELANVARAAADRAARDLAGAQERHGRVEQSFRRVTQDAESSRTAVLTAAEAARSAATRAGLRGEHDLLTAPLSLPDGSGEPPAGVEPDALGRAHDAAGAAADRREQAIDHVRRLAERTRDARQRLRHERERLDQAATERDRAVERQRAAEAAVAEASATLVGWWRSYAGSLAELGLKDQETLLATLASWADTLAGENPARLALAEAAASARNHLTTASAQTLAALDAATRTRDVLIEQRERIERGEHAVPPPPYTRPPGGRKGRAGAPLWQVVDFRDGLGDAERAGLEAALEAAGLLDAWVAPEGRLLDPATHDVLVTVGTPVTPNLGAVLRAAIDPTSPPAAALDEATVAGVLAGIGLGAGAAGTWVDTVGAWRLGVAVGSWAKPAATFVGHGAREAARRQRLAELGAEIAAADTAVRAAGEAHEAIQARQRVVEAELAGAPDDQPLRDAHNVATMATVEARRQAERVAAQEAAVTAASSEVAAAEKDLDQTAADLALTSDADELRQVRNAVSAYRVAAATLLLEARGHADRLGRLVGDRVELNRAAAEVRQWETDQRSTADQAHTAERRRDALRQSIGATVAELRDRLQASKERASNWKLERARLDNVLLDLTKQVGSLGGREQELRSRADDASGQRARVAAAFQRFAATGLLATAQPDLDLPDPSATWAPDPTVRLARRVEQGLTEVDDDDGAWERVQRDVAHSFKDLGDALSRYGHEATADLAAGYYVVSVVFRGQRRSPSELVSLLAEEAHQRERVLNAKEREVLEEHLVNEVASHLQELIVDAEDQVKAINDELSERPTSTGMRLRFNWEPLPDGPPGLAEARKRLLRQTSDAWSTDDRAAIAAFLQEQIALERARDEGGTWLEHLTAALDYRDWHRFTIERWQDGRWRSAAGPASGGERVLTVTLPLFAAASAHYRSAHPAAPRLVLLDEAFAGVDDDARAKCMGLLATFDLDFVMTSEREWGCYPTVGGLAIHQLSRREGIDAVHVSRWEWDGRTRSRVELARPTLLAGDDGEGPLAPP